MPTITEKILSEASGVEARAGDIITAKIDYSLANDVTAPLAIDKFEELEKAGAKIWDRNRIVIVLDHFTPSKDIRTAEICKKVREFARKHRLKHFYEGGEAGIEHELLVEKGIAAPGRVIVGADSHTCTYGAVGAFSTGIGSTETAGVWATGELWFRVPESIKFVYEGKLGKHVYGKDLILYTIGEIGVNGALYRAMEFSGSVIKKLSLPQRLTMANMAVEAGAKNGIIEADEKTFAYIGMKPNKNSVFRSDEDAEYLKTYEWDVGEIEPQVAFPHLPSNVKPVSEVGDIPIDQAVIGSCTNGRLEDLEVAARILKGRKVARGVRLLVFPATPRIYREAVRKGLFEIFLKAGAVISPPTCGPCLGGHMGILASGEVAISTTNRNFVGRMGHPESKVYLASPATVAASAVMGRIADPRGFG